MKKVLFLFITFILVFKVNAQINTDKVLRIARNALYFEDYVLSIQYFNQVIKAKPYLAEPYFFRAIAKYNLDDFKGAEEDITLCIERNPFLVQAYQCRGAARQNMENYVGAIEDYNKGLEFKPEDRQLLINKAIADIQLKKYDDAEKDISLLMKYHPAYTPAYITRGGLYLEKGDTTKAMEDFNTSIKMDKYFGPSYAQRGLLKFQTHDLQGALADMNEAIRLEPKQAGYYINRGLVRYHLEDLRGAMSDYDIVASMEPNNLIARFNRGLLRSQVGDNNRAIEDFDVVISQEPDNYQAIYNRALLREETGDYKGAIKDFTSVIDEYPNFIPGYYARAEVKKKMKDNRGAEIDYWEAYKLNEKAASEKAKGNKVNGKGSSSDKTREQSDKNIDKFNKLVVYDKEEQEKSKYNNELRGRVQDKQVKVDLEPLFAISYYQKVEDLDNSTTRFNKILDEYNKTSGNKIKLIITNSETALTDEQATFHFSSIDEDSKKIEHNPSDAKTYFNRGTDFMVLRDFASAIEDYNKAIYYNPNFTLAYFNRAVVRYKQLETKDYTDDESLKTETTPSISFSIGTKGKSITPSDPKSVAPAKDDSRSYEYELIMRDYNMAIKTDPDFVYAYFNRGNLYCLQKDFKSAVLDYNEAIKLNPEFGEAYFNRGLTRLYLGDTERGVADMSKAGELGIINAYSIIKRMGTD